MRVLFAVMNGFELLRARRLAGLTQSELAARAGVNVRTVTRIERGDVTPNMATVHMLASALGVPVARLVASDEGRTA